MTNGEILKIFYEKYEKYPEIRAVDYRPLCPELFTKNLKGVTIWLENGDVIQYYPKEAQEKSEELLWECERCGKSIPYMADFCNECANKLLGEPPKPFEPQESEDKE